VLECRLVVLECVIAEVVLLFARRLAVLVCRLAVPLGCELEQEGERDERGEGGLLLNSNCALWLSG
jgi:hypothetical protein